LYCVCTWPCTVLTVSLVVPVVLLAVIVVLSQTAGVLRPVCSRRTCLLLLLKVLHLYSLYCVCTWPCTVLTVVCSPSSSTGSHCSTVADGRGTQNCLFKEDLSPVAIKGTCRSLVLCVYLAWYCTYCVPWSHYIYWHRQNGNHCIFNGN